MPVQQVIRYHAQHGSLGLTSTIAQILLTDSGVFDYEKFVNKNSLYRDELLERLPEDKIWYYGSPETYFIDDPVYLNGYPSHFEKATGRFTRDQPFVCQIEDAYISGPTANPKSSDGKYIRDALGLTDKQLVQSIASEKISCTNPTNWRSSDELEIGVLMTNLWSKNPYHWQLDLLPRLRGVEEYERRQGERPTLVVGSTLTEWQQEYLDLLGYEPHDWHNHAAKGSRVDKLIVPYGVRYQRSHIQWLRERLLSSVSSKSDVYPSNIYITRDDALCRRLINEDELMDELYDRGFARVKLSEMSVETQIEMFAQANKVIGPHGAGFANIMFASDASAIEMYGVKKHTSTYHLADVLDQTYGCICCDTVGEDLIVDVSDVTKLLDRM